MVKRLRGTEESDTQGVADSRKKIKKYLTRGKDLNILYP